MSKKTLGRWNATSILGDVLTFHASFDNGVDADWALGDRQIYTAPSYAEQDQAVHGIGNPSVEVADNVGRFGDALRFTARNRHAIFYKAEDNVAYASENWSGTVSFWLSLDPATDLEPGFCDPIQITDAAYNDAAIWVDFTAENPRQFRLGVFGDLDVWNPDGLPPPPIPDRASPSRHSSCENSLAIKCPRKPWGAGPTTVSIPNAVVWRVSILTVNDCRIPAVASTSRLRGTPTGALFDSALTTLDCMTRCRCLAAPLPMAKYVSCMPLRAAFRRCTRRASVT